MMRSPVVAGQFYPGSKGALKEMVTSLIGSAADKTDAMAVVSPHAGYIYSGPVAGSVFSSVKPKSHYIIMGPNHTGLGARFAVDTNDIWRTPLGNVEIDRALAKRIEANFEDAEPDDLAHAHEHSVEVQLPFLQVAQKSFKFVPIVISHAGLELYIELGRAIAKSVKELKLEKGVMIIASSDMTHYEPKSSAEKKDKVAIEAILHLDEKKLIETISKFDISMCGYAPTAVAIVAAKELGAREARLVKYQTSAEASGDESSVVGYAGILIR